MRVIRSFAVARISKTNFFDALFLLRFSNFETTLSKLLKKTIAHFDIIQAVHFQRFRLTLQRIASRPPAQKSLV